MKTLYLECNMGAAGDMLLGALLELHPQPDAFVEKLNALSIPGVRVLREVSCKCGIAGTHVSVQVSGEQEMSVDIPVGHVFPHGEVGHTHSHMEGAAAHEHQHEGMQDIAATIRELPVPSKAKADALAVYSLIAEAESKAHGRPVEAVHFHEVGAKDALVDIVGVCMLLDELAPQRVVVSPVHVGSGQVRCAHGVLPVPTPATAHILRGVPVYGGQIKGELCTPTGAALLKHFANEFGGMPAMAVEAIGYGMGNKEFPVANCVRAFLGEETRNDEAVVELVCNLDDMTGEDMGFALETLMAHGALDVCLVPVQMKKNRPGQMLICLCKQADEENMVRLLFAHTSTFGLRSSVRRRYTLERSTNCVETEYGPVCVKTGSGFGVTKHKAEYEDIARLANEQGVPVATIRNSLKGNENE
ncbi:nickel pincer cofactor biosynthesis protein LarC [Christensenellaceae bacterium OttesenSCG-928-L17]|nr:nickel pincer cofactor biosynthesis protein LarC [Christensenellaceae bacterium OttesenSCG-928-L17]